ESFLSATVCWNSISVASFIPSLRRAVRRASCILLVADFFGRPWCTQRAYGRSQEVCMSRSIRGSAWLLFAILMVGSLAFAQVQNGIFVGTVSDPQGAAVANATVKITNQDT